MNNQDPTKPLEETPITEGEKSVNNRRPDGTFGVGNIANPNGRPPKGYSITETFKEMLGSSKEKKQELADKIYTAALNGDMTAAKMIWSYMDGMPMQATDITSAGEKLEMPHITIDTKAKKK